MWYENSLFRHLCDMHIDDWSPEFLSKFNPDEYVDNLVTAKVDNAMIYFQSHVGLCYYPTKVGKVHNAFIGNEWKMKRLTELCHEHGITVTGYYSLIYNNQAHDVHPDWRMVDENGKSDREKGKESSLSFAGTGMGRYGLCCPNNMQYREFVSKQIREILEYFDVDGMFFDMLFWPNDCFCESCKNRWEKEVGGIITKRSENYKVVEKRREWMADFAAWATNEVRKINPNITVEHNFASALSCTGLRCIDERINLACDYAGGDLYGSPFYQTYACKLYRNMSKNQPFEYMFSRCQPDLGSHTTLKTKDQMLSIAFLTAAHHGASLVIDAIDPIGTLDSRVYKQIGEVFSEVKQYSDFFNRGRMVADVGLYYSFKSKPMEYSPLCNYEGCVMAAEALINNNILCDAVGTFKSFDGYKAIIASCLSDLDEADNKRFIDYVKNGGCLYFSGADNTELLKEFFKAEYKGNTAERITYIAPKDEFQKAFGRYNQKYPFNFDGRAPIVDGIREENVVAKITLPYTRQDDTRFVSIHSNPPGISTDIPAIVVAEFGNGKVIWSALPIECVKTAISKKFFSSIFLEFSKLKPTVISDAPEEVELTVFDDSNGGLQINVVLLNEREKARSVGPFEISVKTERQPKSVKSMPDGTEVPFDYNNGILTYRVDGLKMFALFDIH